MGCKLIIGKLRKAGIDPAIIDITKDEGAEAFVKELGALGVPVVTSSVMDPILGFKLDAVDELISLYPKSAA
ncbi:hypothetical protein A5630_25330 [Mycolicibacterium mucogenicum]|uniref:Glutaredoxin domain-containing protein n=2 Tax=Mycolicibacterium mucogenicum TaxID=56689 RepID=A0A1A3GY27_MYCMU|nr:hypothetical protein A5630_25330 [Mycolicibacterium mucogenicum]